ncbi:hypothetical protein BH11PLA1_BH11PLA1_07590 [soil metagenome]
MRTLIELLRPGSADLCRRWLAALLIVPERERSAVVSAVEARIVAEFGAGVRAGAAAAPQRGEAARGDSVRVVYPPASMPGGVAQEHVEYRGARPATDDAAVERRRPPRTGA